MNDALQNIRRAMRNRARESNIATVARDIGVSAYDLDSFIYNDWGFAGNSASQAGGLCLFRAHETGSGNRYADDCAGPRASADDDCAFARGATQEAGSEQGRADDAAWRSQA